MTRTYILRFRVPFSQGNAGNLDSKSMGSAAALQALKRFTGGQQSPASSSGQSALVSCAHILFNAQLESPPDMRALQIGMAMSEASK